MFGQTGPVNTVDFSEDRARSFTANLAQAAGTYDLCTATGGDVSIDMYNISLYVVTAGATFTSVSVQTNQTNPTVVLTSAEGAVANIIAQKNLVRSVTVGSLLLASGQKLQYTIAGATGTGSLKVAMAFMPLANGATLS